MSLIRFNLQNNHGNPSSGEPHYSPQNGQPNSDDTVFRGSRRCCSIKKVFLKVLQNSQETPVSKSFFFNKAAGLSPATLLKKRLQHKCFSVNFAKFLRTPLLQNTSRRLLNYILLDEEKHTLHSKLERTKLIWDTVLLPIETLLQNLVLEFFGPKKVKCETRKRHI